MAKFTVLGEPKGKGRPRFSNVGGVIRTYTPRDTTEYEDFIKLEYNRQCGNYKCGDGVPVLVKIEAYYKIPKNTAKKKHTEMSNGVFRPCKKPDVDNLIKIYLDALNGIAYKDDAQVVDCKAEKYYDDNPRVVVEIQELN